MTYQSAPPAWDDPFNLPGYWTPDPTTQLLGGVSYLRYDYLADQWGTIPDEDHWSVVDVVAFPSPLTEAEGRQYVWDNLLGFSGFTTVPDDPATYDFLVGLSIGDLIYRGQTITPGSNADVPNTTLDEWSIPEQWVEAGNFPRYGVDTFPLPGTPWSVTDPDYTVVTLVSAVPAGTLRSIGVPVQFTGTPGDSAEFRLVLYADDGAGEPGALLWRSADQTETVPSGGVFSGEIVTGTPSEVPLADGDYWVGMQIGAHVAVVEIGEASWMGGQTRHFYDVFSDGTNDPFDQSGGGVTSQSQLGGYLEVEPGPYVPPEPPVVAPTGLLGVMTAVANQLRSGLEAVVPGIQIEPMMILNPTTPCIDIYPADPFLEQSAFGYAQREGVFQIRARVSTADQESGQQLLLELLDPTGPASVLRTLALDATLGGAVDDSNVSDPPSGFVVYATHNGGDYLGCNWRLRVVL